MLIPRSLATIPINGAKEIMIIAELKVTIRICPRTTQRNQVWCSDVVMIIFEYPSTDLPSARLSRLSIAGARCLPNTNRGIRCIFRVAGRVQQMTTHAPSGWHHSCRRYRHSWPDRTEATSPTPQQERLFARFIRRASRLRWSRVDPKANWKLTCISIERAADIYRETHRNCTGSSITNKEPSRCLKLQARPRVPPSTVFCAHIQSRLSESPRTRLRSVAAYSPICRMQASKEKFISSTPSGRNCSGGPAWRRPTTSRLEWTAWFWPFPVSGCWRHSVAVRGEM